MRKGDLVMTCKSYYYFEHLNKHQEWFIHDLQVMLLLLLLLLLLLPLD